MTIARLKMWFAGCLILTLLASGLQAGSWTPAAVPESSVPAWGVNVNGGGSLDDRNLVVDEYLSVDTSDSLGKYHTYGLLGQSAIDAGAGFSTSDSLGWRVRVNGGESGAEWITTMAAYTVSQTQDKSDLYPIRMDMGRVGVGWPRGEITWVPVDTWQWHDYRVDIDVPGGTGELFIDGVSAATWSGYLGEVPLNPYQGIRWSDQGNTSGGSADWAYVGWGADADVPVGLFPNQQGAGQYVPVMLPDEQLSGNRQGSHPAYADLPAGEVNFGGVPFSIPTNELNTVNNYWNSASFGDNEVHSITIDVNEEGVTDVYTLINTAWGKDGLDAAAKLIFEASDATTWEYELVGNENLRDASVTSTHTSELDTFQANQVFTNGTIHLDMQRIALPQEWASKTLATVTLEDSGRNTAGVAPDDWQQRTWLYGMTVEKPDSGEEPLPGDLNDDGFVGGDDLDIVRSFWGQNVTPGDLLSGDPSQDGFVGGDDLDIVRANWGQGAPPAPSAVPEPNTLVALFGLLGIGLFAWRKGR